MGIAARLRDRFLSQAPSPVTTATPKPAELDEFGQSPSEASTLYAVKVPDPQHIALLVLVSHEIGSALKAIRRKVWHHQLKVVPAFHLRCTLCGTTTDKDVEVCSGAGCFAPRSLLRAPDEEGKHILEEWQREANHDGQTLEEVGEEAEDDGNAHDQLTIVFRFAHTLDESGVIQQSVLTELRRGDPRLFRPVKDDRGRRGGKWWVCLSCREQGPRYRPELSPRPCTACGRATYEAWFVELMGPEGGAPVAYYIRSEIVDKSFHYGGSSPLARLWDKAISILWMDKYVWMAFDPRRDKRADKILVVVGGQAEAIEKWAKKDASERKRNPYRLTTLHVPIVGAGAEARPDAKVVDLGADEIKKQNPEIYVRNIRSIWREYGVSPAGMGDVSDAGGLNNEGLQLRVDGITVEHHQRGHMAWLDRLREAVGVDDWRYEFEEAIEEQEQIDADTLLKYLDVAAKAQSAGLTVRWVDNRPVIADGPIGGASSATNPFIPPPTGAGPDADAPPAGEASEETASAVGASGQDARAVEQASPRNSKQVPKRVQAVFRGPSGAANARDAIYDGPFAGLTMEQSARVKEEVIRSLTQPQGWSVDSIVRRIEPLLEEAGVENPRGRAETIARVETSALVSEWKLRVIQAQRAEGSLDGAERYGVVGAEDFRRTKLSWWVAQQVGEEGRPLAEVLDIMDRGIRLAKAGAFAQGGMLAQTEGEPIKLPANFQRRGFVCHYNDRDTIVRRLRGGGS